MINILGEDDNAESKMTNNILIENNLFDNIGGDEFGGQNSKMIQILGPTRDITFNHNTMINYGSILIADQGLNEGFKFTNNIAYHNDYGILGSGKGSGDSALDYFAGVGFDPEFGARPLRRLIQKTIVDQLADKIIKKEIKDGDKVKVSLSKSAITVGT